MHIKWVLMFVNIIPSLYRIPPQISAGGCGNGLPVKTDAFTFVISWRYLLVEKSNETCDNILFEFVVDKVTLWQSTSMCLICLWNLELADWPNYIPRFSAEEMIDEWRKSTMVYILHKKKEIFKIVKTTVLSTYKSTLKLWESVLQQESNVLKN